MALHDVTDPQVDALRLLLAGGLNAALVGETTEPVVAATVGYPGVVPGGRVTLNALPLLAVYRTTDRETRRTSRWRETLATFRIDYTTPATPLELIDARWPILRAVWTETLKLLCAGSHPAVSGGADILRDAGFVEIIEDARGPNVRYVAPRNEEAAYLRFEAEFQAKHRPARDISALPWFTELFARYDLHHALPADEGEEPAPAILPQDGLIGWWELRDAVLSDGNVTEVPDRSGRGNVLPVAGSGADVTLEADADYGGQLVGVFGGGRYLTIPALLGGTEVQPNTVLLLCEWTTGDGVAYEAAEIGGMIVARLGGELVCGDASGGAVADGEPLPMLIAYDGASSALRRGSSWSTSTTLNPGTGALSKMSIGATADGALPLNGRVAIVAAWDHVLDAAEIAQAVAYLNAQFGQSIERPADSTPRTVVGIVEDLILQDDHG